MTIDAPNEAVPDGDTADAVAQGLADESLVLFDIPTSGSALGRSLRVAPRAFHYLRPYRLKYVGLIVATAASALIVLAEPWPLAFVIDTVLKDKQPPGWITNFVGVETGSLILFAVLAMLAIALVGGAAKVIEEYLSTFVDQHMTLDFRSDLFQHVQRLSLAYHDDSRVGVLMYRINQLASSLGDMVVGIPEFAEDLITLCGMAYILYRIDPHIALLAFAVVPLSYYSTLYYTNRIEPKLWLVRGMVGMQLAILHETLSMLRVVVAFGREDHQYRRFRHQAEVSVGMEVNITVRQVLFQLAISFVTAVGTAAVLGVGAYEVVHHRISAGELVVVMSYIALAYAPLESLTQIVTSFQQQMISFQGSLRILDAPLDVTDKDDAIELDRARGDIEFRDVDFDYAARPGALKGVSFEVPDGQTVAIVGPTGAGKSTLANLIPRFYDPTKGKVLLDGRDMKDLTLSSLRKQFAIVLQEPLLFEGTIADNILYGRHGATREEVEAAAKAANAHDFIMELPEQYDTVLGEGGTKISGGERQRICVARAFLKDAPVLILDEPTSSIDSKTEGVILEALDRLAAGRTTIMIAHRLSTIRSADFILVLNDGVVEQTGTHGELLQQEGLYRQLWVAQTRGGISRNGGPSSNGYTAPPENGSGR